MAPPVPTSSSFSSLQHSPPTTLTRPPPQFQQNHQHTPGSNHAHVAKDDPSSGDLGAPSSSTLSRSSTMNTANRDRVDFSQLDAFERKLRKLKSPPVSKPEDQQEPTPNIRQPEPPSSFSQPVSHVQSSGWKRGEWTAQYQSSAWSDKTQEHSTPSETPPPLLSVHPSLGEPIPSDSPQQKQAQTSPRPTLNQYTAAIHHAAARTNSLPGPPSPTSPAASTIPLHHHLLPTTSRHATLPADLHAQSSTTSATSFLSNPATASLTRGMKTIVDKLMLAPLQVAATTTVQVANLAVPDDPVTHKDRKVLGAIQHTYAQIASAVDTYRSAVYALVEAETGLADVLLQNPASSTSLIDPRLGQALDEYAHGIHAHALSTIAYARALDSFADQLHTFTSRALADCLETSRQANQAYTELELYRATGIAHLVAVNNQIVGGIQRAGAAAVAPALGLFGGGIGKSASRPNIEALAEEPATTAGSNGSIPAAATTPRTALSVNAESAAPSAATPSPMHLSPDSATSGRPRSRSNASTMSASFDLAHNFANDAHASNLRAKHDRLADALAAKTRVLQDKAVTDLAAQLAAVVAFQQGQQLGGGGGMAGGEASWVGGEGEMGGGTKKGSSAGASDLGMGTG